VNIGPWLVEFSLRVELRFLDHLHFRVSMFHQFFGRGSKETHSGNVWKHPANSRECLRGCWGLQHRGPHPKIQKIKLKCMKTET
jgi:hypothetical protein